MFRNPRFVIPLLFGILVAILFIFASVTTALTVTVVGGIVIGFAFVFVAVRSRT